MQNSITFQKFDDKDFDLYFSMVSDPQIMQMILGRPHTEEEARKRFDSILLNNQLHPQFGAFKIFDVQTNTCIGYAKFALIQVEDTEAEIGYLFFPQYWGKGYASSTVSALIENAKTIPQLKKVFAIIDPEHVASRKVLTKHSFCSRRFDVINNLPGEVLELEIK